MRQLKSVFFLLALGVISVLAVLAQDSPTPTITPPHYKSGGHTAAGTAHT